MLAVCTFTLFKIQVPYKEQVKLLIKVNSLLMINKLFIFAQIDKFDKEK